MTIKQTAGRDRLGDFAPEFAHFNDDVLFGENWNNEDIDLQTRCLLTVTTLMAQGITDSSLMHHIQNAKESGVTREELVAAVTHVAFYAGWPKAWATFRLAKEVYADSADVETDTAATDDPQAHGSIFGLGEPNDAYGQYFIGQSYLKNLTAPGDYLPIHNVTFEPGCRNNWHIHTATSGGGQVLICVDGNGWYQEEGKPAQSLKPGDIVEIPANVKHWHGARKDSWFSHIAFGCPGENCGNEWCEPVDDETYNALEA